MFEKQNNLRKWQCFICGQNYESPEDFKSHIIEKHDEGREYITCPDCGFPVRDMKLHYKTKHPSRNIPKNIQTRVAVWNDFKGSQKKQTRKPTFRQGKFLSQKCKKEFDYRSGMECEFFECLEEDTDVLFYNYETIKIPYFFGGKWHNYIPDLKVTFIDNSVEIWEIKPANQTNYEKNKSKWFAADNYCTNMGWQFVVLTEVGLGKLKTKLRQQHQRRLLSENGPSQNQSNTNSASQ